MQCARSPGSWIYHGLAGGSGLVTEPLQTWGLRHIFRQMVLPHLPSSPHLTGCVHSPVS